MSDEPQPQQPKEGVAPKKPLPAEGPGTPGATPDTPEGTERTSRSEDTGKAEGGDRTGRQTG
ncbi:hypothetical protein, partial [Streptomyces misionensis]|uniref:hypothetical protein n=1 Tax=Streptomyces misionensis TaxID=67331 RepID=UPI0036BB5AD7